MKRPERLAILTTAAGLALAAAGAAAAVSLRSCGALDRLAGRSGCVASLEVSDLASLRQTVAFDPVDPGALLVAGTRYARRSGRDLSASAELVRIDLASGDETARIRLPFGGVPERLALSRDGRRAAISCNAATLCDFAPAAIEGDGSRSEHAPLAMVDLVAAFAEPKQAARAQTLKTAPAFPVGVWPDGRTLEPVFSPTGDVVAANGFAWGFRGARLAAAPAETLHDPRGSGAVATADGPLRISHDRRAGALAIAGADGAEQRRLALDLPTGFVAEVAPPLVLSPDGSRVAALSRRFAGPGEIRAVLQVWEIGGGKRLARYEFGDELSATLAFTPDGARLLVAEAVEPAHGASTRLRFYPAGGGSQ